MNNLQQTIKQLLATRESGAVRRAHVMPTLRHYDVAQHCYNCVSMLLLLHPEPSLELTKALLWHDLAERWMGDIPHPAKNLSPSFALDCDLMEDRIHSKLLMNYFIGLKKEEVNWLESLDTFELWLWCREETALGNTCVQEMQNACLNSLSERFDRGGLPEPIREVLEELLQAGHVRLPDFFDRV